ncbi:MAG: hypothetical protein EXQ70_05050 [Solirubrobacterales bacterium]|nr:hypothetical protein [Solirubrobacterales bacterium]
MSVGGREPKALLLNDGTRLALEEDGSGAQPRWMRVGDDGADGSMSVAEAVSLAGEEHADYVRVRTRSEAAWLRVVAEWFEQQADELEQSLGAANRAG